MAFGIGATGFVRPSLIDVIEENRQDLRDLFGPNINVGDNSRLGMLTSIQSNREFRVWQNLEATYNSQTINGAEGSFLDEIFATSGILRRGSSPSTGRVLVETDNTSPDSTEIVTSAIFSGENTIQYRPTTSHLVSRDLRAYKIDSQELIPATYVFNVIDQSAQTHTLSIILQSGSVADRRTFLQAVMVFFNGIFTTETSKILMDNADDSLALYVGFELNGDIYETIGLDVTFQLTFSGNRIGNRYTEVSVQATTSGFFPLGVNGITSMITTPVGFIGARNIVSFFSGRDPETDGEFFVRAQGLTDAPLSSTRPAIIARVLEVDGVVAVSINKSVDLATGLVSLSPFVLGGTTEAVGQALYNAQSITTNFLGNVPVTIATEDNSTEVVRFSRAQEIDLSVRVTYRLATDRSLSQESIDQISEAISTINQSMTIESTAHFEAALGSVYSTDPIGFNELTVELKRTSEPDSSFASVDIVAQTSEIFRYSTERVSFIRLT